jgi:hypothetical protein
MFLTPKLKKKEKTNFETRVGEVGQGLFLISK